MRECTKNLCQPPNTVCTSSRTCAVAYLECAHGVRNVLTCFVPIHMLYGMCIEASPLGTSNRVRTISWVAYVPGEVWGRRGAACISTMRVHSHRVSMRMVPMLLRRIFWVRIICHTHVSFQLLGTDPAPSFPSCRNHFALSQATRRGDFKSSV